MEPVAPFIPVATLIVIMIAICTIAYFALRKLQQVLDVEPHIQESVMFNGQIEARMEAYDRKDLIRDTRIDVEMEDEDVDDVML